MDSFGELMLFGTFTVLKGDGGGKDQEKEVRPPFPIIVSFNSQSSIGVFWNVDVNKPTPVSHLPFQTYTTLLQRRQCQ